MQCKEAKQEINLRTPKDQNEFIISPSFSPKSISLLIARQVCHQVRGIQVEAVVLDVAASMRLSACRRMCRPCTWVCRS
jgi:predicted transcriptional regulator